MIDQLQSWLKFNYRVLTEATRTTNPIIERLNFIGIADSNLDEFIRCKIINMDKILKNDIIEQTLNIENICDELFIELEEKYGIKICKMEQLRNTPRYTKVKAYFKANLYPLIQPLILKDELPLPYIDDGSMFIITKLETEPKSTTGIIRIPTAELVKFKYEDDVFYVINVDIIEEFISEFYRDKIIRWSRQFRIFRRVDSLQVETDKYYIDGIREGLSSRDFADIIMVDCDKPINGIENIIGSVKKRKRKYVHGLSFLKNIKNIINTTPNMVYSKSKPKIPVRLGSGSIFDTLTKTDVLVHFPYQSFNLSTQRFLNEAAYDPNVLSIRQTLYRVSKDSPIVDTLITAAKNGKQVVVLLELKAKMDEYNNLIMVDKLKSVGCHVIFGPTNMKIHGKTILVIRREGDKLAKYINISTGNYNNETAKIYEDLSYFGKERKKFKIGNDLCELFNYLGGCSELHESKHLLLSPLNLRSKLIEHIDECIANPRESVINMKMNSLTDIDMANKLVEAADAGVKINLIVRGMCILEYHDNIKIKSVIGRYLEHSRIYEFTCGQKNDIYIGSADLMTRNLDHRVEVLLPIKNNNIKITIQNLIKKYLEDTTDSYVLNKENIYELLELDENATSIQNYFIEKYKNDENTI